MAGSYLTGGTSSAKKKAFIPSAASTLPPGAFLLRKEFHDWDIVVAVPANKGASQKK